MQITKIIALSAVMLGGIGTSAASASTAVRAHTPSGNINCVARNYGGPGWSLTCSAADPGRTMRIDTRGDAYKTHYRRVARGHGFSMAYDGTYKLGPYTLRVVHRRTGLLVRAELGRLPRRVLDLARGRVLVLSGAHRAPGGELPALVLRLA